MNAPKTALAVVLFLFFATSAFAKDKALREPIMIPEEVPFAAGLRVPEPVRNECKMGELLASNIMESSRKSGVTIEMLPQPDPAGSGRVLLLEITNITGAQAGALLAKSLVVRGELHEGGEVTASFVASRYTTKMSRSCGQFATILKRLGGDIAKWLKQPTLDARLGKT